MRDCDRRKNRRVPTWALTPRRESRHVLRHAVAKKPQILPEFDEHRDRHWRREGTGVVESAIAAERFIEQVGFAACLTDSRRPGPSLYIAVCGRRDAVMPRNVQKDPEASLTWTI